MKTSLIFKASHSAIFSSSFPSYILCSLILVFGVSSTFAQSFVWKSISGFDTAVGELYGFDVDISEEHRVVSAPLAVTDGINSGAVYVYEKAANGDWINEQRIVPSDLTNQKFFGYSVGTLVMGLYQFPKSAAFGKYLNAPS